MGEFIIQLVTALLGSLGFALVFGLRQRHLAYAALGGMIAWGIYLALFAWRGSLFLANLGASVFAVAYSELLAHRRKCPATVFVIPAIIPLVPGSSLYYAMEYAVRGDLTTAKTFGHRTLVCALAIAAGISFASAFRELRARR